MKTSHFAEPIEQESNGHMRSKLNLRGSANGRVAGKLSMSRMPLEWLDAGSWRLPSGQALAEFALQAGFVAPLLFRKAGPPRGLRIIETALSGRAKHLGKGGSR